MNDRRRVTIQHVVPNLKARKDWGNLLDDLTDDEIAEVYEDFSLSEDFGNNDEKFPNWVKIFKRQALPHEANKSSN